jgi:hypothetical protein
MVLDFNEDINDNNMSIDKEISKKDFKHNNYAKLEMK